MQTSPNNLTNLCRFMAELIPADIPGLVLDHAKLVLLDTLGVILAGSRSEEARHMSRRLFNDFPESRKVPSPGNFVKFDALNAALIGGLGGSTLEYEEGNSRAMGHPAIQIIPALLAASESANPSGAELITSLIAGYEAACRISRAASIRKGLHPTGTWGVVGCALAVGVLNRSQSDDLFHIANIAAAYAFSPYVKNSFAGQNVACTFAGLANYLGLLSNIFYQGGIRADAGSFQMTFSKFVSDELNLDFLDENLGRSYAIFENYFKPYPTCRFTHPALEALKSLLGDQRFAAEDIETIKVTTFKAAVHGGNITPANVEAWRFSVPYLVAAMLLEGDIGPASLSEERLRHPRLRALADKVELIFSPEYERLRPSKNAAEVTILLKDGQRFSREITDCPGDPGNPLPAEDIRDKFRLLAAPVIGHNRCEVILNYVVEIEKQPDVKKLPALLRPDHADY